MYEEVEHLAQSAAGVSLREKEEEEERNREGEERSAVAAEQEDREEEEERGGGDEREEQEEEKEEGKEEEGGIIPPGENGIGGVFSHGGKFAVYDLYDNIFEVSSKYRPPLIPIGRGAYGVVCSAFNKETNEHVAIKKIPTAFDNHIDAKRTLREIKLLRHLDHDNVLGAKDIIPPPSLQDFNDVYLVFELMDTDLQQIIRSEQALSEDHCKYFLYQILRGLKYIHSANILHRDLKPSNLLLNANCDLRICDFGLARTLSETEYMTEYVVTRWYRAPELLLNSTDYTGAIDVWSVGCIYMELLLREPLIPGRDYVHQLKSIIELLGTPVDSDTDFVKSLNAKRYLKQLPRYRRKPFSERFPQLSPLAVDLMQKMLAFNPRKRITVEEALAHPYLSGFRDEADEPVCHRPFKLDYNEHSITTEEIKEIIYKDALELNPQLRE